MEKKWSVHKWFVELTSKVEKFTYDLKLPMTVKFKCNY